MSGSASFSISSQGVVVSGFEPDQVKLAFSELFGVPPEKAAAYTDKQKLIKKDLSEKDAEAYRMSLEAIGVAVVVHGYADGSDMPEVIEAKPSIDSLSLLPTGDEIEEPLVTSPTKPKGFSCPKCDLGQTQSAECIGCGVIFEKLHAALSTVSAVGGSNGLTEKPRTTGAKPRGSVSVEHDSDRFPVMAFVVPIVVMIACAFLWKFIALSMDRELGLIAWGIGGAIGAAAVFSGARGQAAAAMCAVLVVIAIFGGKYMFISSYQEDIASIISDASSEEMQDFMDMMNYESEVFAQISRDETSIKQFMYDYEYTEASQPRAVTDEELAEFREYIQPMLEDGVESTMSAEQYFAQAVPQLGAAMNESVWSWVFESLGLIDMLFLFLGCGTAFRLVSEAN